MESINNPNQESSEDRELKEKYREQADEEGFVPVSAFSHTELGRQTKSIASFVDGDGGTNPDINFGEGLRYKGESGNYTDVKIHIDDLPKFIKMIKEWYGDN